MFQESIMEFFKEHAVKGKTDTEIVKVRMNWCWDGDVNISKEVMWLGDLKKGFWDPAR